MTILEAFSTGTPVIASNMGIMAEIVKSNYNGLHFEPANEADLVRKIEFMCSNLTTWKQMSQNARHTYQEHYTPEKSYELLMDIYSDLVLSYKL
jgi:glycosyltransferase involved in cell wall biosynthesis